MSKKSDISTLIDEESIEKYTQPKKSSQKIMNYTDILVNQLSANVIQKKVQEARLNNEKFTMRELFQTLDTHYQEVDLYHILTNILGDPVDKFEIDPHTDGKNFKDMIAELGFDIDELTEYKSKRRKSNLRSLIISTIGSISATLGSVIISLNNTDDTGKATILNFVALAVISGCFTPILIYYGNLIVELLSPRSSRNILNKIKKEINKKEKEVKNIIKKGLEMTEFDSFGSQNVLDLDFFKEKTTDEEYEENNSPPIVPDDFIQFHQIFKTAKTKTKTR